jgi:hypothetical protein
MALSAQTTQETSMYCIPRSTFRPALALLALVGLALALAIAASPARAATAAPAGKHRAAQRLVVRGDATAVDGPCDAKACQLKLADGRFSGTPVGSGAYTGAFKLKVGQAFPNGEGGICAPLEGRIVLGAGTPDRLVLDVAGDSCQDGAGPLTAASFTGLAQFTVAHATGAYAGASATGLASLSEDAAKHHHMTLVGRLWNAS